MKDISLGQFIKNAFDYSTGKQPTTNQPQKSVDPGFQQAQQAAMNLVKETVKNIQNNFVRQNDILNTQMQLKQLTSMENSLLLKDLFEFPREIKDFLQMLMSDGKGALTQKELSVLMTQNIDITKLLLLMQTNGKSALEKIAKMITTMNQSGIFDTQQLKEMSKLINACIPVADANPSQVLKNLMIMYIPWLPLSENTGINIGFEEGDEKENKQGEDTVTIMITTKHYGIIKVFIYKDGSTINLEISCNESFPKEELKGLMKNEQTQTEMTFLSRKASNDEKINESKINFSQSAKISPQLLIITHAIIKHIMDIDKRAELHEARSSMMND